MSKFSTACFVIRYSHEEYEDLEKDKAKYLLYYAAMLQV